MMKKHEIIKLLRESEFLRRKVERFYGDLQNVLELTSKKRCPFHYRGLECKSRTSGNTWSNKQI